jgi:YHS domain-containing protein
MFIDPVCYQQVDPAKTSFHCDYGGRKYYFCSCVCRDKFDFEPGRYADEAEIERLYKMRS